MRITPGEPLPPHAPVRVIGDGEYEGFEGVVTGRRTVGSDLSYIVTIKGPDEEEGMEFTTDIPADRIALRQ